MSRKAEEAVPTAQERFAKAAAAEIKWGHRKGQDERRRSFHACAQSKAIHCLILSHWELDADL